MLPRWPHPEFSFIFLLLSRRVVLYFLLRCQNFHWATHTFKPTSTRSGTLILSNLAFPWTIRPVGLPDPLRAYWIGSETVPPHTTETTWVSFTATLMSRVYTTEYRYGGACPPSFASFSVHSMCRYSSSEPQTEKQMVGWFPIITFSFFHTLWTSLRVYSKLNKYLRRDFVHLCLAFCASLSGSLYCTLRCWISHPDIDPFTASMSGDSHPRVSTFPP